MEKVTATSKITFSEYRNLVFGLYLKRPNFYIFLAVAIVVAGMTLQRSDSDLADNTFLIVFVGYMLIFMPIFLVLFARRSYKSTAFLKEEVTYTFTPEGYTAKGQTFESTLKWDALYKVQETANWFLLYQNRMVAQMVPKSVFSEVDIELLRVMIQNVAGLKSKLQS